MGVASKYTCRGSCARNRSQGIVKSETETLLSQQCTFTLCAMWAEEKILILNPVCLVIENACCFKIRRGKKVRWGSNPRIRRQQTNRSPLSPSFTESVKTVKAELINKTSYNAPKVVFSQTSVFFIMLYSLSVRCILLFFLIQHISEKKTQRKCAPKLLLSLLLEKIENSTRCK